ncbi:peroxiredoxin Ahp1p [Diutina catenulata]
MTLTQGSEYPKEVELRYVPLDYSNSSVLDPLVCERPGPLNVDEVISSVANTSDHYVVVVSVPGAFTPTCTEQHVPGFLAKLAELKAKHVGALLVTTANDAFVVSAWGKLLAKAANIDPKNAPKLYFASDTDAKFATAHDLLKAPGRAVRSATAIDANTRKIVYFGAETESGVHVSGVDNILGAL